VMSGILDGVTVLEGEFQIEGGRFALVAARFNSLIVESLVKGAVDTLKRHGIRGEQITLVWVPGSWELPLVAQRLAATEDFDAIIALGAIIRGGTPHFEYVAAEASKGLAAVSSDYNLPVSFGVLTTDSIEQAVERAGTKAGNKGAEAALTALEMVSLLRKIDV